VNRVLCHEEGLRDTPVPHEVTIQTIMNLSTESRASLKATIAELSDFDTALIANTMGYVQPVPAHEYYMSGQIQSVTPAIGPTVGVAVTVELDSASPGGTAQMDPFWRQLDEMQAMGVPTVWVVRCVGTRPDHQCALGDGMAKLLHAVGCAGVVTDGGVRDVSGLLSTGFAAYCRGTTIHHGQMRLTNDGKSIDIGGITVHPGDIIHANAEGVIRIPPPATVGLASKAVKMRAVEHAVHLLWRRTDIPNAEKRQHALKVFEEYGFSKTKTGDEHELK
jgi:4-hydroxy-4-methyl-2-oxoglutarate aldolase